MNNQATNPNFDYATFEEWVATRPEKIQSVAKVYPPDKYYCFINSDARYTLYSYDEEEDGTISVKLNTVDHFLFPRTVFGVSPKDLLPGEFI